MKTFVKNLRLLPVLIVGIGLIPAGRATAQNFTTLHNFAGSPTDGSFPYAGVILSGSTLYGTAAFGGTAGNGMVFKLNTDGSGFTTLYNFSALGATPYTTNSDGAGPTAGLILSGTILYGIAPYGGSSGDGTVFKLNTDGTGFTTLHSLAGGSDGSVPYPALILSGGTLYGTAGYGGASGAGTVFKLNTDGNGFTTLHSFTGGSDGANPTAGLILSGTALYGTAQYGGDSGWGSVFKVNTNGTSFTTVYSFTAGSDGSVPYGGLILSGSTLYGTAQYAGDSSQGTVFQVNTDGTAFTTLHSFTPVSGFPDYANDDGVNPAGGLILSGTTLYGTAQYGGTSGAGTVFAVNTDDMGFTTLHSFSGSSGGSQPVAGLILSGNTLYGTTAYGGKGTVFRLSFPSPQPQLTIMRYGTNVVLTWPTNAAGFNLQSTTNLVSPVWTSNSPLPVVVDGQYTVTNPLSGKVKFYRLIQ